MTSADQGPEIAEDLLLRIAERAPGYDREGRFCWEDLADLRRTGYLRLGVPDEDGPGLGLRDTVRVQRTLAEAAPATALGLGMHQVWVQAARAVSARGGEFLGFVTESATADRLLAFGVSEPGNDRVLFDSTTAAVPDGAGGYVFTGTKTATSLAPAWDVLSVFGRDDSDPENPRLVHGFALREDSGHRSIDDWDTLGMRATQSRTTILDGLHVPAARIVRTLPVGPTADVLVFGIFAAFELLVAAVYVGIAERAVRLAVEQVRERTGMDGTRRSEDPDVRRAVADMRGATDAVRIQVDALARDVDDLVDHGNRWFPLLVGTKARTVDTAAHVVDEAMRVVGGGSFRGAAELSRLARDVRAGQFHPSSRDSAARTIAASVLGPLDA